MRQHAAVQVLASTAAVVILAGCGSDAAPSSPAGSAGSSAGPNSAGPNQGAYAVAASTEQIARATVLEGGEGGPQLCLAGVAESYPPQCSGPDIPNWDWDAVDQEETANSVTWGTYELQGTWDGTSFTLTRDAVPYSQVEPAAADSLPDPLLDPGDPGPGDQARLEQLQMELSVPSNPRVLYSSVNNGRLFLTVPYDDGTIQDRFDREYGPDLVVIRSALEPAS